MILLPRDKYGITMQGFVIIRTMHLSFNYIYSLHCHINFVAIVCAHIMTCSFFCLIFLFTTTMRVDKAMAASCGSASVQYEISFGAVRATLLTISHRVGVG